MMDMEINAELERDGGSDTGEASSEGSSAASVYCTLEQDYARITSEMKKNKALGDFEAEYTRLFESLYRSQQLEHELSRKCEALGEELTQATARVSELEAQTAQDAVSLAQLDGELVSSKELADAAHTREQTSQQVIENLRLSIAKLTAELEQKSKQLALEEASPAGQQQQQQQQSKQQQQTDKEGLAGELDALKQRLKSVSAYRQELEGKLAESEQVAAELQDKLDRMANELAKEKREHDRADTELQALNQELGLRLTDLQTAENTLKTNAKNAAKQEQLLREQVLENEKSRKEIKRMLSKQVAVKAESERLHERNDKLIKESLDKSETIKEMTKELQGLKEEASKLKSQREYATKKLSKEASLRIKSEDVSKRLGATLSNAELEIADLKQQLESEKKNVEKLNRDKEAAAKSNLILEDINKKLGIEVAVGEQTNRKLETSLEELTAELNQIKRNLKNSEKEKDRCLLESRELVQQIEDCMEHMKLKRLEAGDYQRQLAEAEAKLRQQQTLFEDVRSERNAYKKSLEQSQTELSEAKAKIKSSNQQITQMGEQLAAKEATIQKQEFLANKAEKDKDALRAELANCRQKADELRHEIEELRAEERRLRVELQEAAATMARQRRELNFALNERDALGAQLVRRNDELVLQHARLQLLGDGLAKGEVAYADRLREIRALKLEVKRLSFEKATLTKTADGVRELRAQIFHLERQLAQERLKVSALEEELQNPMNVHRWRNLEGTDPDTFDLLRKIQILQKRILKMSSEMIEKEKKIEETEKLYVELRETIAKQPGPEVIACLSKTRRALKDRGKKIKCLIAELNMTLSTEHKFEIEKIKKELNLMKVKCLAQKKQKQNKQIKANVDDSYNEKNPIDSAIHPPTVIRK